MNLNEDAIAQTATNVRLSVQVAIDPKSDNAARLQANQFFEDFRSQGTPLTICGVGFALSSSGSEAHIILSGLQLIEYVAKFKWNELEDRQSVKDRLLQLMRSGVNSGSASWPNFVQEGLSKVIVEIAKREWPQLWPDLFPKLFEIANVSDLPFFVLRRMAEDVVTLQLVDCSERRRELSQSLNTIAPEVISTLFNFLISSVQEFNSNHSDALKRRAKVCLGCLLPYIEWLNPIVFTEQNRASILFALLPEKEFQMEAADCLIQLLERKPLRKEDKYVVPKICLEQDCCKPLIESIEKHSGNVDFFRKIGEIITLLAPNATEGKTNVQNFFTCVLKLSGQMDAVSVLGSATAINQYLKANNSTSDLTNTETGKALICLLNSICNKFVSSPPTPAEKEELSRLKVEFSQMLRHTGKRLPKLYKEVNSWLHSSLGSPNAVQMYQWETLVLVIDAVASSISHEDKEMVDIGLRDLELCYNKFKEESVLELKSIILSTVSALFVFLALAQKAGSFGDAHMTLMHSILESVFYCFGYDNVPYARDIRRHAAALMIKLSTRHPDLLVLAFDLIHSGTTAMASKLTSMEYTTIIESLLITSNCWNDPLRQSKFVTSLLDPTDWNKISTCSESFQTFVPSLQESSLPDTRILFSKNLTLLNSIIRRVKKSAPAKANGVLQQTAQNPGSGPSDTEGYHPAYDVVCPLLPIVFKLVKTIHSLVDDPQLVFLIDLSDSEKSHIMGVYFGGSGTQTAAGEPIPASIAGTTDGEKSYPEKLKVFIQNVMDLTYSILGGTPSLFSPWFYGLPQVGSAYLSFVGYNNAKLADFRLRGVIRGVYTPFLLNCPSAQFANIVKPFLINFCPFMLERLVTRWTKIENANTSGEDAEDQEILENTSLRLLSKDYIELLHKLLESKSSNGCAQTNNNNAADCGDDGMNDDSACASGLASSQGSSEKAGENGQIIISDPTCFQCIMHLCIHALCWDDSNVSLKAARCILLSLSRLVTEVEMVRSAFGAVLRALCVWHESEANLDSLFKVLDGIFKSCHSSDATLRQLLKDWGANDQDIQKLIALCQGLKNDKKRKDMYRKMVINNPALEKNRSPKAQWLRGLPQLNASKSKDSKLETPDFDLSECFSVIHQR